MKKITFLSFLFLIFLSCNKREDKIEMYLLKHYVRTNEGVPVLDLVKAKNIPIDNDIRRLSKYNFDTISKTIIYGGKFSVEQSDIEKVAFLENSDFISLDLDTSEFKLSENALDKISKIESETQFVITVNNKPVVTGYFRYNFSSNIINWNYFHYLRSELYDKKYKVPKIILYQNNGYVGWMPFKTNLNDYPILIDAFKNSNRLIN